MAFFDLNSVEWVLQGSMDFDTYRAWDTDEEEQENIRKYILSKMDDYLSRQRVFDHLVPEYGPESLLIPKEREVFSSQVIRYLPSKRHAAQWYEIYYLEKGKTTHFVENGKVELKAGDVLILPPGVVHFPALITSDCKETVLKVRARVFSEELLYVKRDMDLKPLILSDDKDKENKALLIHQPDPEKNREAFERLMHVEETGIKMLPYLLEEALLFSMDSGDTEILENREPSDPSDRAVRLINQHFSDISLSRVAKALSISTRQAGRYIQMKTGMSFIDFRTEARLKFICDMLANTEMPVVDIIESAGFHHNNFFYNLFDEHYHMTPTKYRENHQKE